jgi:hypothetical protein
MSSLMRNINDFFEGIPDRMRTNRWKIWLGLLLLVVALAYRLPSLKIELSADAFLEEDDPYKVVYDRFKENFGGDDFIYIVYKAKDGDVFSESSLKAVKGIQDELLYATINLKEGESSVMDHIVDVQTLNNVNYMEVEGDTLRSRDFIGEDIPTTLEEREKIRQQALRHKDYPLFYLSKDSQYGGILIRTDFGTFPVGGNEFSGEDPSGPIMEPGNAPNQGNQRVRYQSTDIAEYAKLMAEVNKILQKPEYTHAFDFHPVGNPVIMAFFNDVLNVEMETILDLAILLMFVILFMIFRSFSAVVWPLVIIILSSVMTLGFMGWFGIPMTMMAPILILLIFVIGIAVSVHILSGYRFFRESQYDHRQALRAVYSKSGPACLLTSITTSIGLMSLIFIDMPPIRGFGIGGAIGVMLAFVVTILLLPLMLDLWKPISRKRLLKIQEGKIKLAETSLVQKFLQKVGPFSYRHPVIVVVVFLIMTAIAGYGVTKLRVDSNLIEAVDDSLSIKTDYYLVDKVMGGTQNMEVFLKFETENALKDVLVLNAIESLQETLKTDFPNYVVRAESIVNVVKTTYQQLNGNREDHYMIPQDPTMLAQTLLLFENANLEDRQRLVTDDYRYARISIRLYHYGSLDYLEFFEKAEEKLTTAFEPVHNKYPEMKVELTGGVSLLMRFADLISWAQIESFTQAFIVISLILLIVFGSLKLGFIAIIPNIFPVLVTFGVMGFFGVPLDADTIMIAPIIIGIAVDDTIHFLTHYRIGLLKTNSIKEAINGSIREAGQAIVFSTLVLVIGFGILVISNHKGLAHFGYLIGIAFTSALLSDLLFLPSLCTLLKAENKSPADTIKAA